MSVCTSVCSFPRSKKLNIFRLFFLYISLSDQKQNDWGFIHWGNLTCMKEQHFSPSIFHLKQSPACIIKMLSFWQIGKNTGSSPVSPRGKQNNFIGDFNLDVHCESFLHWERFNVNISWFSTDIISEFHLLSFGNSASKFTPDWFLLHENSHWIIVNIIRKAPMFIHTLDFRLIPWREESRH